MAKMPASFKKHQFKKSKSGKKSKKSGKLPAFLKKKGKK